MLCAHRQGETTFGQNIGLFPETARICNRYRNPNRTGLSCFRDEYSKLEAYQQPSPLTGAFGREARETVLMGEHSRKAAMFLKHDAL